MDGFFHPGVSQEDWIRSEAPTVIDYNHHRPVRDTLPLNQTPAPVQPPHVTNFNDMVQLQLQMLNSKQPLPPTNIFEGSRPQQLTSFGPPKSLQNNSISDKYNPFVEDVNDDMDISDEEKELQNFNSNSKAVKAPGKTFNITETPALVKNNLEVKSGAAFYQGLILYIPPFEQLAHSYRGSPALKMLYASFEFSFKMPVRIETKPRENEPNIEDAVLYFKDNIISIGSGQAPHVEASVRALELLSETCYTIQAKEDYFLKCKVVDAEHMRTLNLKKWENVSEKYPTIVEVANKSHIQKTFAVFLDNHTSTGIYEDIVCCNLTREDVSNIKSIVEFFHLTMLPCSVSTNLSKKGRCVVSIHKYTSAKKLLDILIECGGENDKFLLHPPDTFKDFYQLHPDYWDPSRKNKPGNKIVEDKTTLDDPALHALIMKPYENIISELFEKHKTLPKADELTNDLVLRKAGDEFMKNTFQIDMTQNKNVAPVERMQLLLKYMEQLQEYGSRVLTSGRADMIKIYHNAIDNVRKDLDQCRKDIEKEQKGKENTSETKRSSQSSKKSKSPASTRKTSQHKRSRSPAKRSYGWSRKSASPKRRGRSKSPRKLGRSHRSPSPRRRPRSPLRKARSPPRTSQRGSPSRSSPPKRRSRSPLKSSLPRRRSRSPLKSSLPRRRSRSPLRSSPPRRRSRSPLRSSPPRRRSRSPLRSSSPRRRSPQPPRNFPMEDDVSISIIKDQFRRYMDTLRRFRIEIEDTPIERRSTLSNRMFILRDQLHKFKNALKQNPHELSDIQYELEICRDELSEQDLLIKGKSLVPSDLPFGVSPSPPPAMDVRNFNQPPVPDPYTIYLHSLNYPQIPPPSSLYRLPY